MLGYNVKFPEFDNCAEALSQKTLRYQGVKGHVVGSLLSDGLGKGSERGAHRASQIKQMWQTAENW